MKRYVPLLLAAALLLGGMPPAVAAPMQPPAPVLGVQQALAPQPELDISAKSALLMEAETGTVLYQHNAHTPMEPASVTKVMTLLLIMEALENGQATLADMVGVSVNAMNHGGSQVYLQEGEHFPLQDMLKAIAVVSANDACIAVAEHLYGSEAAFVAKMNEKAAALGMKNTLFINCTGLPASGHLTTAHDIALMSQSLLKYEQIFDYTTIWMDSFRDGTFGLNNTNKLIRFYEGATGLKTGFTNNAMYCLSATAKRENMSLIAVVLGAPTSDERFDDAKSLLNYGFSGYALVDLYPAQAIPPVSVVLGEQDTVQPVSPPDSAPLLIEKSKRNSLVATVELSANVQAPVEAGQQLGSLIVTLDGQPFASLPLVADQPVPRLGFGGVLRRFLQTMFMA